ncbi:MAG: beta-ketoacyl-[acyl-carrier-protein] synthase family protein [Opitutaceae bacterium]|jgi:3-oxoacyl-[acyl-carrier-protein] synthase-1|nr:beta-ketoacyl-[acyl-carrier-protein] synthase family protein [Opitutaceae bacterium]
MRKVYITGVGFITSIGNDAVAVSDSLRELRHGMIQYQPFQKADVPVKVAAPIRDFITDTTEAEDWVFPARYNIRREVLRGMAPHGVYAYCAMQQAVEDAKLSEADYSNPQTGLYAASGGSPFLLGHYLERMRKYGVMRCQPLGIVASISGTVNFNLVSQFKIKGASTGFSSACASSAHAMGFAYDEIALGRQKRMFVVGGEDGNVESILPFAGMRALSLQADPALASRPFDAARDGFVGTGGGAVLVLESEEEVERRGAKIYCELAGWGQGSDGHNVAISHPEGAGLQLAIENALRASGVEADEVDYINAHATSTPIGDISEAKAILAIFKNNLARTAVSSTKALTGHGLSLSGAMEAGFCALAIKEGFMPGSAHITKIDPACAGLNIIRATLPQRPQVVLSNSCGFGGANVSLVFRAV